MSMTMTNHFKPAMLALATVVAFSLISPLIHPCGWFRADAQVVPAPTGHRQPTAAEVSKTEAAEPSQKTPPVSPADLAMERALNNICRGCSPTVAVGNVPRYDVGLQCGAETPDTCRRDEERARNELQQQWTQFTKAARSNCLQTTAIGGRPSYVQLAICLKAAQIAPTLPEAR